MTEKRIHIVSFDVPFQPDYGGILDVYLRARALKANGYFVILHCFEYGRGKLPIDPLIADEVHFYKRRNPFSSLSSLPYILNSRRNNTLLKRLLSDNAPVILEGQHSTACIEQLRAAGKRHLVRMHNVEWNYYTELANREESFFKRTYFRTEARRLRHHEVHLYDSPLLCISEEDLRYYQAHGATAFLAFPPLFFDHSVEYSEDRFALFHGNLSVSENVESVRVIAEEIKRRACKIPIIVAGKRPSPELMQLLEEANIQCIPDPSHAKMNDLLHNASVHLCPGFQQSGLKLKLLRALETGHPCIATKEMLHGTPLESYCEVWENNVPLTELIEHTAAMERGDTETRLSTLKEVFSPKKYADLIDDLLFRG